VIESKRFIRNVTKIKTLARKKFISIVISKTLLAMAVFLELELGAKRTGILARG